MMLTEDNGILTRAGEAKEKTELSSLKEETQMVMLNRITEKKISGNNAKKLKEDLESEISNATVESINTTAESEGLTDVYYVSKNGQYVTVYEDGDIEEGKVEIWDGKKVSCPEFKKENNIWNWYIYTPSQLKFLADFVNNGDGTNLPESLESIVTDAGYHIEDVTMSANTKINLMNNLDLGARQTNGTKTAGESWTPIGTNYNNVGGKLGIFEGNSYTIKGVYVKTNTNFNGIFGNSNTIQDLTIKDSYIEGTSYTGGIAGSLYSGKIENCHNKNTIIKTNSYGGGITGFSRGTITYCSNTGSISANYAGGIVGNVSTNDNETINNCINNGTVKGKELIGGIVGALQNGFSIIKCTNNGMITGEKYYVGGIVGCSNGNRTISECTNSGAITGEMYVGGIVGVRNYADTLSGCNNTGIITGKQNVGGIYGYYGGSNPVTNCIDNGKVNIIEE